MEASPRFGRGLGHTIVLHTHANPTIPQVSFPGKGSRFWREFPGKYQDLCVQIVFLSLFTEQMRCRSSAGISLSLSLGLSLRLSAFWMPLAVNDFISNPLTAGWKYEKMDADISLLCGRGVARSLSLSWAGE